MEVQDVVQAFKTWDVRGSGVITRKALTDLIRTLSPDILQDELDRLFEAAADDGLRLEDVKYEEFIQWLWEGEFGQSAPADGVDPAEEEKRRRGLWEGAMTSASSKALEEYPPEKVQTYFQEVGTKLQSKNYADHVKSAFFDSVDADHDGKISFDDATSLIAKCLQCAADLSHTGARPTMEEIRAAFDAHDTLAAGRGMLGVEEFLNLMRYLQVKVAEAALPMSRVVQN